MPFVFTYGSGVWRTSRAWIGYALRTSYRKVTIEFVVHEDDLESALQTLSANLESYRDHTAIYDAEIREEPTGEPASAAQSL